MARNQEWCKELCPEMFQILTKQGAAYEESRRITSIRDTKRTMAGNQHQHHWTITKIKQKRCYSGYSRLIYKDDST